MTPQDIEWTPEQRAVADAALVEARNKLPRPPAACSECGGVGCDACNQSGFEQNGAK